MCLVTGGTLSSPRALVFFVRPTGALIAHRMCRLQFLHHFLFGVLSSRLESRAILDTFIDSLFAIPELVFMRFTTTDWTYVP